MSHLKAPNGKPSNLTPEQWKLVRTPQFKAWFGDWENDPENASKVVDENGEPLVVYHASPKKFNVFQKQEKAYFFSKNKGNAEYFVTSFKNKKGVESIEVYSVFLNIKNLFNGEKLTSEEKEKIKKYIDTLDNKQDLLFGQDWDDIKNDVQPNSDYQLVLDILQNLHLDSWHLIESNAFQKWLKDENYGGFIVYESGFNEENYGLFNSKDIKLADGSNTTFDGNNPDIRFAEGGTTKNELKAPNGKPSNLTPEQWKLVRTPQFKAWFGDWQNDPENASKVIDENGEPLVVYHGTNVENPFDIFDFNKADLGFHFGTYEQAKNRSETKLFFKNRKSVVNSFFLNIQNIYEMSDIGEWEYPPRYIDMLVSDGLITESDAKKNGFYRLFQREDNIQIREYLFAKYGKFIGFIYNNKYEGVGKSFIVLNPEQIKLADGSNTTFDGNNPDIRFAEGGEIDKSSIKEFADSVEAYQSNHYGSFNRDELVEKYLNLPNSIKQKIAPRSAKNLFRGADSFISKKSAISFTKNKDYANFFGAYTIPFSAIRTHEGLIDTKKLGNLLYSLKINNEVGDDEGEVIVIKPIFFEELSFDNPNIEQYRNEKFSEGGTTTNELKAPNGKPSNLTPEQWKLVRTAKFKAWFGDWENDPTNASKVVDENGEPLVVYHGTYSKFNIFDKDELGMSQGRYSANMYGFYFSNNKTIGQSFGKYLKECFIKIKKPITIDLQGKDYSQSRLIVNDFVEKITSKNDGAILFNYKDSGDNKPMISNQYIVSDSNRIKLADGSNTTFDGNNPDIRFAEGGTMKNQLLAPNGKPSNLTPKQWKLVRTPQFKEWFGDWENDRQNSGKVSGITKEPSIWYHSTKSDFLSKKGENIFKNPPFFFALSREVSENIVDLQHYSYTKKRITTKPFFVRYKNPFDITKIDILSDKKLTSLIKKHTFNDTIEKIKSFQIKLGLPNQSKNTWSLTESPEIQEYILSQGYDSFFVYEDGYKNLGVFDTEQIKLADGSNTTFDGKNSDIRFAEGGTMNTIQEGDALIYKDSEFLDFDNVIYVQNTEETANGTLISLSNGQTMFLTEVSKKFRKATQSEINRSEIMSKEIFEKGGKIRRIKRKKLFQPKDLSKITNFKNIYRGAEYYSLSENSEKQIASDRWFELFLKNQKESKLTKDEFSEFIKLSKEIVWEEFKQGGETKRTMKRIKRGGITYGKSHAEGGIPVKNQSTGDMLEVEGGEGIVNKRSMASDKKVTLNGKEMTICEAVSQLNQLEGGVQFSCDDVSDQQFIEAMAKGGELERGIRTEQEHIKVLKDLYAKRITPKQASKRIASDHLKEDSRYYSKLAKMEGQMADGGKVSEKQLLIDYQNEFLTNKFSTNLDKLHKSSEFPYVINQRLKMAKSYARKKIAENKPKRFFDVTYKTKFGAYHTERNILAIDQNEAWSEVRKYNSDIEKKYSVVLSKLQPKTSEQKMADGGIMADGGEVLEKYSVTKKPDENLFLYIIYTESGEKVPSKLLPKDIGYGKIENKFEAKRRKYDPSLGLRDAQDIVRVMNKREQGKMADGGKVKDQYKIPSTEQMVEMVMREKDKAIQRNKELGIRVVIGRYDGYGATLANGEYIETILASRPSRRKVIEIIESNPEIIEVFFLGTIRGAMRVGEEMDFLDDFLVNLWKKPIEPNKAIGITFQWTDTKQDPKNPNKEIRADEGIYMIVNQEDAHLYKDRPTDDTYLYVNDYNEKNGEKSSMRIPKSDFQRLEEEGAIEIIKVSKAIQEELLKPMPIYADGGMIGFENTKKLIEEIKKHSDYSQGTISTTKNGEKYRYDHWKLSHKHASDWMIRLFEKASKENTGLEYNNEFIFGDNYSFSYARPQFKGQPNGKIGMSQLILLDGAIANDGIMVNSKKLGK